MRKVLVFDLGASSGRAMLGFLKDGRICMEEIHRFPNEAVTLSGRTYWDFLRLMTEIKTGITKAVNLGGFDALSVDTWGVDFGLLDKNGHLLSNPVHYRDRRTESVVKDVFDIISKDELYTLTGTQFVRTNTLYQLMSVKRDDPHILSLAAKMLMMPDLIGYMLTGEMHEEATIASTSNLFDPEKRDWNFAVIDRLGLPRTLFAPVIEPGSVYGYLSDAICEELGCEKVPVIAVGSHDTASAVVSVPTEEKDFVYISCGTWSLFGTELSEPNNKSVNRNKCYYHINTKNICNIIVIYG